jgi:hypothetical protein
MTKLTTTYCLTWVVHFGVPLNCLLCDGCNSPAGQLLGDAVLAITATILPQLAAFTTFSIYLVPFDQPDTHVWKAILTVVRRSLAPRLTYSFLCIAVTGPISRVPIVLLLLVSSVPSDITLLSFWERPQPCGAFTVPRNHSTPGVADHSSP